MRRPASAGALRGKTVLITGGASGLGATVAEQLGEDDACLVIADRAFDVALDRTTALAENGIDALPIELDVGDEADVRRSIAEVRKRFGRLDVVVNNVEIGIRASIAELASDEWERVVRTNLTGPFLIAKHAASALAANDAKPRGHLVNIASVQCQGEWPNPAACHVTKWGLLGLSQALRAELEPRGIKVTALMSAGMRTPYLLEASPGIDPAALQDSAHVARALRAMLAVAG